MNKYNVGDKFIIEISKNDTNELDTTEYYITNGSRVYEKEELDRLQKYDEVKERLELIDELKMDEYNKGLNDGRNEVWELANKIFDMDYHTTDEVFGCDTCEVMKMTPQEALAKLEAYEKEQNKIKAGYVYEIMGKFCAVVQLDEFNNEYHIIWCDGGTDRIPFETPIGFKKTGKHIDIQSILQQIGE